MGAVTIVGALSAMYIGTTGAFFSDTETSTGNTFAAGDIDLLVDNESYYNGNVCAETSEGSGVWEWEGNAPFPVPGTECTTSWTLDDLTGHLFFNFTDIKPDDEGEDTISLHVDTNDAYMCMNIDLTENDDNSTTEPESEVDTPEDVNNEWDGELAQTLQMVWWADDEDNVLEVGETVISGGVQTLFNLASTSGPFQVALADSATNVWTSIPGPVEGEDTVYIGKAWCFGTLSLDPVAAGQGVNPSVDSGVICDGVALGNITQTDSTLLDVSFDAVQARNNPNFLCDTSSCDFSTTTNLAGGDGFETPVVATAQLWDIYPSPVNGWNVEWRDAGPTNFGDQVRPVVAQLEYHRGVLGSAFQGQQYVELDTDWFGPTSSGTGEPASARIYKDIATTPGAMYKIHFAFAPRPNTTASENRLEVRFGGNVVHDTGAVAGGGGPIAWTPITIDVQATSTTTRVEFTDLGTSNSQGTFLDDLRFTQESCALPQQLVQTDD